MGKTFARRIAVLDRKLAALPAPVRLYLPGGKALGADDTEARVELRAHDLAALRPLLRGDVGDVGSAWVEGHLDIDGAMRDVMRAAAALVYARGATEEPTASVSPWRRAWSLWQSHRHHTRVRDARQIEFHYDLSDDFYALWLDPRRVYSCAYFRDPGMTLAAAQEAKLDHVCRKLALAPGERFLDIGAGWGALLLWAAEHYGVDATGITLSQHQHEHVSALIAARGLGERVRMLLCDYRALSAPPFDKIASVGMVEHVGRARLTEYFDTMRRLLKPGGLALNHGITAGGLGNDQLGAGMGEFIERYIFPGGELHHVSTMLGALSDAGLEALDVENLRPHYARTLAAWSDALEAQLDAARALVGERTLRAYRLYLAGCAMCFEQRWISLYQILAAHPDGRVEDAPRRALRGAQSDYPFNRDYMVAR